MGKSPRCPFLFIFSPFPICILCTCLCLSMSMSRSGVFLMPESGDFLCQIWIDCTESGLNRSTGFQNCEIVILKFQLTFGVTRVWVVWWSNMLMVLVTNIFHGIIPTLMVIGIDPFLSLYHCMPTLHLAPIRPPIITLVCQDGFHCRYSFQTHIMCRNAVGGAQVN